MRERPRNTTQQGRQGEAHAASIRPRWPGFTTLLVIGVVYAILRDDLRVTPAYLLLVLMVVITLVSVYAHMRGHYHLSRLLGLVSVSLATVAVGTSLFLLVALLLLPTELTPFTVLRDAGSIWVANVATFAVWYWMIDEGGPGRRPRDSIKARIYSFPRTKMVLLAGPRTSRTTYSLPSTRALLSALRTPRSSVSGPRSCL